MEERASLSAFNDKFIFTLKSLHYGMMNQPPVSNKPSIRNHLFPWTPAACAVHSANVPATNSRVLAPFTTSLRHRCALVCILIEWCWHVGLMPFGQNDFDSLLFHLWNRNYRPTGFVQHLGLFPQTVKVTPRSGGNGTLLNRCFRPPTKTTPWSVRKLISITSANWDGSAMIEVATWTISPSGASVMRSAKLSRVSPHRPRTTGRTILICRFATPKLLCFF